MAGRGTDYSIKMGADISDLEGKLSKARQSIENFGSNAQVAARGMDGLFKAEGLDSLISEFDSIGNAVKKMGNVMSNSSSGINQQMRTIQQTATQVLTEFRNLSEAEQQTAGGQALYAYYQQLIDKGAELRDNIGDVKGAINAMADDSRVFTAMGQGVQVMASSFQVAAGAASVLGVSEEKIAAVQQKLTSIIAITNGLQQINNLLQKESALMQTISIARTQGLAVALGLKTAAQTASNAATEAGTAAQLANNAAVMANPYVLAAVAIAALVAGIALWISSLDEATEAELATQAATEALTDAMDSQMKKAADQISAFMKLKQTFDDCGGSVDKIRKKVINNTEAQKKAGIQVKNLDQATRIFSEEGTKAFINGANARAMAMAAEAATAAQLALVMKELGTALAKIASGEEVNIADVEEIAKKAGMSAQRFKEMARAAGFYEERVGPFARNNLRLKEGVDAIEAQQDLMSKVTEFMMNEGTGKVLQGLKDAWNTQADIDLSAYNDVVTAADDVTSATDRNTKAADRNTTAKNKNRTASQGSAGATQAEKTALEQLDEQYNKLVKTLSTFGKETEQNKGKIEALKKQIRDVLSKKINLMPMNTIGDVDNMIKAMELFLQWVDKDSDEYKKFTELLNKTKISQAEQKLSFIDTNTLEGANAAKQIIDNIVKILPSGSKELEVWSQKLKAASDHARNLQNEVNGIQEGSITELKQRVSEIDRQLQNVNLAQVDRQNLKMERENLQVLIEDLEKLGVLAEVVVRPKIDVTFDYKKTDLEKIEREYEAVKQHINDLYEAKKKMPSTDTSYDEQIQKAVAEGQRLKALLTQKTILEDLKAAQKEVRDGWISLGNSTIDSIDSMYGAWSGFSDKINDENANSFEKIMSGFKAVQQTVNTVLSFIETIKTLNSALDSLKAVSSASEGLGMIAGEEQVAQVTQQAAATTALATAEGAASTAGQLLAVSQTEVMATTLATVAGVKALSNAYLELAASEYLAAHASIPFVGYALGAGFAVAAKALVMSMQAFAHGGIVGGNRLFGDMQYVRINAGEMVLSGSQQKKLFNLLDGGYSTLRGSNGSEVTFKVKGRDLIAVMNNQNDKMGRIR